MSTPPDITPPEDRERYIREQHRQTGRALLGAPRAFYGWGLVVLGGCILAFAELPYHLVHEYQEWENTGHPGLPEPSIALSLTILVVSLTAMPLAGLVIDRIGSRRTIMAGLSLGGAGLLVFALPQSAWTLYPYYFLTMLGAGMGGWLPVMVAVCRRFYRRRAMAIALANSVGEFVKAIPFGVFTVFFAWSISPREGWISWNIFTVLLGLAFVVVAVSGYAVLTLRMWGAASPSGSERLDDDTEAELSVAPPGADFTAPQALRTRAFRLIAAGNAIAGMATASTSFFLVSMLTDKGYSLSSAAYVFAFYSLALFCSTLAAGFVGDRYSRPRALAAFIVVQVAGLALLAVADGLALMLPAVALVAIGAGGRITLSVTILASYFGTSSLGKILGWSEMLVILATTVGFPLSGLGIDSLGYTALLLILAGLSLVSVFCFLRTRQPPTPDVDPAPLWAPSS